MPELDSELKEIYQVHFKCKEFLDRRDFKGLIEFTKRFDSSDKNELKKILSITKSFKEEPEFKNHREELVQLYEKKKNETN